MENPLQSKSNQELRQIVATLSESTDKQGMFYAYAVLCEQELMFRHLQHPATEASFGKYGTLSF